MKHQDIFSKLWDDYTKLNPSVQKVYDLFTTLGETVENDHIAFRTFNDKRINIDKLSKVFINAGYEEKANYYFEEKHLNAKHYEHKTEKFLPRVFISELILENFSDYLNEVVIKTIDSIPVELLNTDELIFSGSIWGVPSFKIYEKLKSESEYAGWLYVMGFRANHFTVNVNALKQINSMQKVNNFIKNNGFKINAVGGEIKGTPEELLEQSSIMSEIIKVKFEEGEKEFPGCFYEFAKRYPDKDGNLFSGFIANSANKIFESTDFKK